MHAKCLSQRLNADLAQPGLFLGGRQVAQSVERRTLEVEVRGSKLMLGTWWCCRIPPYQPYPKGAALAATTLLAEW